MTRSREQPKKKEKGLQIEERAEECGKLVAAHNKRVSGGEN